MKPAEIATIIVATVVPFLSVFCAQWFAGRAADRSDLRALLAKVIADIQAFRHAVLETHPAVMRRRAELGIQNDSPVTLLRVVTEATSVLNTDRAAVMLLLGSRSEKLAQQLQLLIRESGELVARKDPATVEAIEEFFTVKNREIGDIVHQVWKSRKPW